MNISREIKKEEAIKRMEALGLFAPCIKAFKDRNEVQLTEPTGGLYEFSSNEDLTAKVQEFEKEHNALVYHVIHTPTIEMDMYNFLYVSDYDEEWEMEMKISKRDMCSLMYGTQQLIISVSLAALLYKADLVDLYELDKKVR